MSLAHELAAADTLLGRGIGDTVDRGGPSRTRDASSGGGRQRLLLAAISLSAALGFIDTTAVAVALPSIQKGLDTSTIAAHWIVIAFLLTSATLVAAAG